MPNLNLHCNKKKNLNLHIDSTQKALHITPINRREHEIITFRQGPTVGVVDGGPSSYNKEKRKKKLTIGCNYYPRETWIERNA